MPKTGPEALSDAVLKRLRRIRQTVKEYPGLFPSEDSLRWQLRMLRADYGNDLRMFGVYRFRNRILIDPLAFTKATLKQ